MKTNFKVGKKIDSTNYHIFNVESWEKQSPDWKVGIFTSLNTPNWVGAVVFNNETNKFVCVREFRHGVNKTVTQFPCGTVEKEEDSQTAVIREVCEELGISKNDIVKTEVLYKGNPNPAFMNNTMTFFLIGINSLNRKEQKLDTNEFINVVELNSQQVEEFVNEDDAAIMQKLAWTLVKNKVLGSNKIHEELF